MSGSEFGIIIVGALVGWWAVSWIIDRLRPKPPAAPANPSTAPAAESHPPVPKPAPAVPAAPAPGGAGAPSLAELGERWWQILGVERSASLAAIEAAYHARLAALDAVRFSAAASDADRARAIDERVAVEAAYEFIRTAGSFGSQGR